MSDGIYTSPFRSYRTIRAKNGEKKVHFCTGETDLLLTVAEAADETALLSKLAPHVVELRRDITEWCRMMPSFRTSLVPVTVPKTAPEIVRIMARAGKSAGVGPFASVAGAIAEAAARHTADFLESCGLPRSVLVENGGDTYIISEEERLVGLLPDPESGMEIGLRLTPGMMPCSVCASSATIGHSLSLGKAELCAVRAASGACADAWATAYCNLIQGPNDIEKVLKRAERDHGSHPAGERPDAVFISCDGSMGAWGDLELAAL